MEHTTFVGLVVHKRTTSVALAEPSRGGEVRFLGEIPSTPEALHRLIERLKSRHRQLSFCYEAGPCGYGVHRLLSGLGQDCSVVAPSLIPSRPGDRVKTNCRDATTLAKLHRAGELTAVWVPDAAHEAIRDLVRARPRHVACLRRRASTCKAFSCATAGPIAACAAGARPTADG